MEKIARFLPATLSAVLLFVVKLDFTIPVGLNENYVSTARTIGLLFPAFYLAGIGPRGLLEKGGFLMRTFSIKPSYQNVALVGLIWLLLFIICSWFLYEIQWNDSFIGYLLCGLGHTGLMASLGVYIFLAVSRKEKS